MNEKVKLKYKCEYVTDFGVNKRAHLTAVFSSDADLTFLIAPGELDISYDFKDNQSDFFKPNESYYIGFEKA